MYYFMDLMKILNFEIVKLNKRRQRSLLKLKRPQHGKGFVIYSSVIIIMPLDSVLKGTMKIF